MPFFYKNSTKLFSILMFNEQQISILEWFLKDNVTLKTGVVDAERLERLKYFTNPKVFEQ